MHQPLRLNSFFICLFLSLIYLNPLTADAATLREMYESAVEAYNKGQYDQAIEIYQDINKQLPQFAPAYIGLGLCLKAKGADPEEVLYYYKTAVDKDPTNAQAYDQLGRLYYSNGQTDKALGVYEKALKINPNMPQVKLVLAWIYLTGKRPNPEKAIIYFKDAIKSESNPNAYYGLGMAYFADNQREKALDIITQLKMMKQDELANKLEKAVRENRRIVFNQPEISSENQAESNQNKNTFENTSDNPKGIKVRLKAKLDSL